MAKEKNSGSNGAEAQVPSSINILAQYVKDLSFECRS